MPKTLARAVAAVLALLAASTTLSQTLDPAAFDTDGNGMLDAGPEADNWLRAANQQLTGVAQAGEPPAEPERVALTEPVEKPPDIDVARYALETGTVTLSGKFANEPTQDVRKFSLESGWDFKKLGEPLGIASIVGLYVKYERTDTELATQTSDVDRITVQPLKLQWETPFKLIAFYLKGGFGYSETETENLTDGTRARKSESEYIWTPGLAIRTCASWLQFTFEHDLHLRDVVSDKVSDATSLGVKFDFNAWRKNTKPPGCGKSS
jgi:hypothetical protein